MTVLVGARRSPLPTRRWRPPAIVSGPASRLPPSREWKGSEGSGDGGILYTFGEKEMRLVNRVDKNYSKKCYYAALHAFCKVVLKKHSYYSEGYVAKSKFFFYRTFLFSVLHEKPVGGLYWHSAAHYRRRYTSTAIYDWKTVADPGLNWEETRGFKPPPPLPGISLCLCINTRTFRGGGLEPPLVSAIAGRALVPTK